MYIVPAHIRAATLSGMRTHTHTHTAYIDEDNMYEDTYMYNGPAQIDAATLQHSRL